MQILVDTLVIFALDNVDGLICFTQCRKLYLIRTVVSTEHFADGYICYIKCRYLFLTWTWIAASTVNSVDSRINFRL